MGLYYFDVIDSAGLHKDEAGIDLPDMEAAITEARRALAEMTIESKNDHDIEILIRDHGEGPIRVTLSTRTERSRQ